MSGPARLPRLPGFSEPAELQGVPWAEALCFEAYGLRIGLRVSPAGLLARLVPELPFGWRPARSARVEHLYSVLARGRGARRVLMLHQGAEEVARGNDLARFAEGFGVVFRRLVAEHARTGVFVHAGVVAWGGRALLIPGRSHSGKTTLVAELVKAGAEYYSDEYAVLDAHGRVRPYATPLALRLGTDGQQTPVDVAKLGGVAGQRPLPVAGVLVTRFRPGARWRPRELSGGQAVLRLLPHAVAARRRPADVMAALQAVAARARLLHGVRGEAKEIVPRLFALWS